MSEMWSPDQAKKIKDTRMTKPIADIHSCNQGVIDRLESMCRELADSLECLSGNPKHEACYCVEAVLEKYKAFSRRD